MYFYATYVGKGFTNESDRIQHLSETHKNALEAGTDDIKVPQSHRCKRCGKSFTHKRNRKIHELIGSATCKPLSQVNRVEGEPLKCQFCDKQFKSLVGKVLHENKKKCVFGYEETLSDREDPNHMCCFCGKLFETYNGRLMHENRRTCEKRRGGET